MKSLLFVILALGWILADLRAIAGQPAQYGKEETLLGRLITLHDPPGEQPIRCDRLGNQRVIPAVSGLRCIAALTNTNQADQKRG